jgi:hypothetical protein
LLTCGNFDALRARACHRSPDFRLPGCTTLEFSTFTTNSCPNERILHWCASALFLIPSQNRNMASASIVRVGPSENNLSANILTKALVSYFESTNDASGGKTDGKEIIDTESRLVLQNKYFTANVILKDIDVPLPSSDTNNTEKEDGVILVFDALLSNPDRTGTAVVVPTFESLTTTHQQAEKSDICGDLLRLCVGVSLGEFSPPELRGTNHEIEYSRRILWCLDHGYEYIEADLSQEGQQRGHDDRDKDGFARIVEAIQGTVWSSAVVGAAKTKQLKESYASDKASIQESENDTLGDAPAQIEQNPYLPPDPSLFKSISRDNIIDNHNGDDIANAKTSTSTDTVAVDSRVLIDPNLVGAQEMAQLRQDLEAEKFFDQMETLLKHASDIREKSKSGTMSDAERRERASEAALALVDLMGQFGLEDGESEGDDSVDSGVVETVET